MFFFILVYLLSMTSRMFRLYSPTGLETNSKSDSQDVESRSSSSPLRVLGKLNGRVLLVAICTLITLSTFVMTGMTTLSISSLTTSNGSSSLTKRDFSVNNPLSPLTASTCALEPFSGVNQQSAFATRTLTLEPTRTGLILMF